MPITIDKRVKKKNGVSRYRVRINYTDTNGEHQQIERLVWGKENAKLKECELKSKYRTVKARRASHPNITEEQSNVTEEEDDVETLRAENARLRAALEEIASVIESER